MQRLVLVSLAAAAVVAVTAPPVALGQGPSSAAGPLKIAFVNSREILQHTPGYARAESTYLKEVDSYRNKVQKLQQHMEQRTTGLQDRARQREQELLQPIQARVSSVIQGIRAEQNYAL